MRTEFLFSRGLPDEESQYQAYRKVLEWAAGKPVTIRTVDAGGDKPVRNYTIEETNPFLGLRGIRLSLARPDVFAATISEKMLIYALGRGLEPVDMPVVRSIVKNAAAQNYAMQSIVLGIVRSVPFQMRTTMRDAAAPVTTSAAR